MGGYQMSNESSDAFKIRRAPQREIFCLGKRRGNIARAARLARYRPRHQNWQKIFETSSFTND